MRSSTDSTPLDTLLDQCERIVTIHEHLRMDTEEDERVRLKGVEIARRALGQCRDYVERVRALGPRPTRAAALRDVETLLRRVDDVMTDEDDGDQVDPVRFTMPTDRPGVGTSLSPAEFAALIVDRVLGTEQNGEVKPNHDPQ